MKRSGPTTSSGRPVEPESYQPNAEPTSKDSPTRALCVRVPVAAQMLGVGLTKMYELIGAGEVQIVKLGRVTLVPVASLEQLIARHLSKPQG